MNDEEQPMFLNPITKSEREDIAVHFAGLSDGELAHALRSGEHVLEAAKARLHEAVHEYYLRLTQRQAAREELVRRVVAERTVPAHASPVYVRMERDWRP